MAASTIGGTQALELGGPQGEDPRAWVGRLARYRGTSSRRALIELTVTALPFLALWVAMWLSLAVGYWLTLLLALPAAGLLVRLFVIQHDCGHGSFFGQRRANDWLGRVIGVLTLTPYGAWRHQHALHHGTSGNLDRRGEGDVETLTVREFHMLPAWRRLLYRSWRNPLAVLGVGPLFVFVLKHRLPEHPLRAGPSMWRDVMAFNLVIAAVIGAMVALMGARQFLLVQLPITWLASAMGVWLFYVQHQFERTFWEHEANWTLYRGGLLGSSHLDLPAVLRWFTANIGMHHVHHLSASIPSYRLAEVLRDHPELRWANRLTLRQSLTCFRLALWDEDTGKLVSFGQARRIARSASEHSGFADAPDKMRRAQSPAAA
ncbi:MAG: fatty acid desaturase [Geminicoccaceae bacterium]